MTNTLAIALNKLTPWKGNVRKTGAKDGIEELAISIASHGLLQSLVVRKAKGGKYEILAGRRRFLALQSLAKAGRLRKDHPIACTLANDNINASELSLAENVIRAPMHPADQFEAFRIIVDAGATTTDVAARFGVPESLVTKRLKLGRLSPVILDAYRQGNIDLEAAQAFTITDDHEAQERVFADLPEWNRGAHLIRRALTESEIPASDKRVQFVGLDAYEAAGGSVRRDLFDERNGGYVQDAELLDRLVADKLATIITEVSGEGWSWVETLADLDYESLSAFSRRYPEQAALSESDQAELDQLTAEYDALADDEDADSERLDQIEQRIDELNASGETWPAETLVIAGAVIGLNHDGSVCVERGRVRKDDERKARRLTVTGSGEKPQVSALPAKLVVDLTAQKTAAMGAELIRQPDIALVAVVYTLSLKAFYSDTDTASCLELSINRPRLRRMITSPDSSSALTAIEHEYALVSTMMPEDPARLWDWCLECTRDELLRVLALVAANAVNIVEAKIPDEGRFTHGAQLAQSLALDMGAWFTPTAENYFGCISRSQILAAIDEAKGAHAPALDKLKKGELAARAQDLVAASGWLPAPLRGASTAAE